MALKKLVIQPYEDQNFSRTSGSSFSVQINPSKITHQHSVQYTTTQPIGGSGSSSKFSKIAPEKLSMDLVFDNTGIVPGSQEVSKSISDLKQVVYNYNGKIHSPNYLVISWGTIVFKCHLTSLNVNYSLFRPDGSPLRAKINLEFLGFSDALTTALKNNQSSPDLTHIIEFKEGDNLPNLCYKIYGNVNYYKEVAKANNIVHYRSIPNGTKLYFPPLSSS